MRADGWMGWDNENSVNSPRGSASEPVIRSQSALKVLASICRLPHTTLYPKLQLEMKAVVGNKEYSAGNNR